MQEKIIKGEFKYSWQRFYNHNSMETKTINIKYEIIFEAGEPAADFKILDTEGDHIWPGEIDGLMEALIDKIELIR